MTVFDVGAHHGQLFIAMEPGRVDGASLRAWLRRTSHTTDELQILAEESVLRATTWLNDLLLFDGHRKRTQP